MSETCATCRFWLKKPHAEPETGFCRRKPKRYIDSAFPDFRWPPHNPSDWCGEHRPAEQPERDAYTRAAVELAEADCAYELEQSGIGAEAHMRCLENYKAKRAAFLRLYREKHGG